MNKDTIKFVEMHFSQQDGEDWVELIFYFKDGSHSVVCSTAADCAVVKVLFLPNGKHVQEEN